MLYSRCGLSPIGTTYTSASQKWNLSLNTLDWVLERTSLIGKKLTLKFYFGLRASWLDEDVKVNYLVQTDVPANNRRYEAKSNSWGIGPEITGVSSHWLLGKGFKFYADAEADLLYTRYTSLNSKEQRLVTGGAGTLTKNISQHQLSALRPHCDIELGITWGSYLCAKTMHAHLLLGYNFQVFWSQNMFRKFVDDVGSATSLVSNGDLFLGLTASVRFDF